MAKTQPQKQTCIWMTRAEQRRGETTSKYLWKQYVTFSHNGGLAGQCWWMLQNRLWSDNRGGTLVLIISVILTNNNNNNNNTHLKNHPPSSVSRWPGHNTGDNAATSLDNHLHYTLWPAFITIQHRVQHGTIGSRYIMYVTIIAIIWICRWSLSLSTFFTNLWKIRLDRWIDG